MFHKQQDFKIILDFSKALDCVPHSILQGNIKKLAAWEKVCVGERLSSLISAVRLGYQDENRQPLPRFALDAILRNSH